MGDFKLKNTVTAEAAVLALLVGVTSVLLGGWLLMLLLGMFAGYMVMPGLAIGYWASTGIFLMLRLAFAKSNIKTS